MVLLDLDEEEIFNQAIDKMFEGGDIVKVSEGERECVFLTNMYMAESSIATRIAEMSDQKTDIEADIDKYIEDIENKFQIEYAVSSKKRR
jgi:hypothetical protein